MNAENLTIEPVYFEDLSFDPFLLEKHEETTPDFDFFIDLMVAPTDDIILQNVPPPPIEENIPLCDSFAFVLFLAGIYVACVYVKIRKGS